MPLTTFRRPVGTMSGKLGVGADAIVYYMLDGRGISRQFTIAIQPNTTEQQLVRSVLTSLSQAFTLLSQVQIAGWREFGENYLERDALGQSYRLGALQAFQRVNAHRLLAGQSLLSAAPLFVRMPGPAGITIFFNNTAEDQLDVTFTHFNAAASGFWRVRFTPVLYSLARQALATDLRSATVSLADAYFPIAASPQKIEIPYTEARFSYVAGNTAGVEILALSSAYVPGLKLFDRRVVVG